jgi:hypothetical protein
MEINEQMLPGTFSVYYFIFAAPYIFHFFCALVFIVTSKSKGLPERKEGRKKKKENVRRQLSLREALGHDDGPFPSPLHKERPTRRLPWLALVAEEHF